MPLHCSTCDYKTIELATSVSLPASPCLLNAALAPRGQLHGLNSKPMYKLPRSDLTHSARQQLLRQRPIRRRRPRNLETLPCRMRQIMHTSAEVLLCFLSGPEAADEFCALLLTCIFVTADGVDCGGARIGARRSEMIGCVEEDVDV